MASNGVKSESNLGLDILESGELGIVDKGAADLGVRGKLTGGSIFQTLNDSLNRVSKGI
jgi:hypothetical protein